MPKKHALGDPDRGNCLIDASSRQLLAIDTLAAQLLGIDPESAQQQTLDQLFPGLTAQQRAAMLSQSEGSCHIIPSYDIDTAGSTLTAELRATKLISPGNSFLLLSLCLQNSSPEQQPTSDPLTGLPDRRHLALHLTQLRESATTQPPAFALLFLDLDNFKSINDQHGHATGDQILRTVASRWQNCLRSKDLVTRYGGDEFIILLAGIANPHDTEPIVQRLTAVTRQPIAVDQQEFVVTVTIGIALSQDPSETLEELIATADRDMYAAKRDKKHC